MRSRKDRLIELEKADNSISILVENSLDGPAMVLLSQAIEVCGSLLDNKPGAARDQGRKRFSAAIQQLFPSAYNSFTEKLYKQWRCHSVHSLIPGKYIVYSGNKTEHLKLEGEILLLHPGSFYNDFRDALQKLKIREQGKT